MMQKILFFHTCLKKSDWTAQFSAISFRTEKEVFLQEKKLVKNGIFDNICRKHNICKRTGAIKHFPQQWSELSQLVKFAPYAMLVVIMLAFCFLAWNMYNFPITTNASYHNLYNLLPLLCSFCKHCAYCDNARKYTISYSLYYEVSIYSSLCIYFSDFSKS